MRLTVLLLFATACYNDPTENSAVVRERYVERHADTFTLRDKARVHDALETVLFEEGYELVPTEKPRYFQTNSKPEGKHATTELTIHLLEIMDGTVLVQIMELWRDERGDITEKKQRTDLEWLVAQRAEPDRALALMKKANERADKVPPITRKK
ncbi:MAG: hypothetical protein M4D80_32100 [Myxococcota bacterium]|nr:hypothetical protein [Myxococcota bacterium]